MPVLHGSCLCGGVKYEIAGPLFRLLNCHCSMCRKAQGAAFRSRAGVKTSDLKLVQVADLMTYYESSPGFERGFCRVCGSPTLDGDPGLRPERHVFVANKAPWFEITDDLPQHQGWPPVE
jgi:hypothetical protein